MTGLSPAPPPRALLQAARQETRHRRGIEPRSHDQPAPTRSLLRRLAACLGLLLLLWGTSCAHRLRTSTTAHRTEETRATWQTAETAEQQTQSVATEKKSGSRETKRFRPDGTLMEQVSEQWGSDGRVQVSSSASASASATGADFRSVVAASSSTKASDTRTSLPWFRIGAVVGVAIVVLGWYGWKRWRVRLRLT